MFAVGLHEQARTKKYCLIPLPVIPGLALAVMLNCIPSRRLFSYNLKEEKKERCGGNALTQVCTFALEQPGSKV